MYLETKQVVVNKLFHCSYWDGPINGVAEYQGKYYWFQQCDEVWNHEDIVERMEKEDAAYQKWLEDKVGPEPEVHGNPWHRRYALYELTEKEFADEIQRMKLFYHSVGCGRWCFTEEGKKFMETPPIPESVDYYQVEKSPHPDYSTKPIFGWFEL